MRAIDPEFKDYLDSHPLWLIHCELICATINEVGNAVIKLACSPKMKRFIHGRDDAIVNRKIDKTFERVMSKYPVFKDPEVRALFDEVYEQFMMDRVNAPRDNDGEEWKNA